VNETSASQNNDKVVSALKNSLRYVLADDEYSKCDRGLGKLGYGLVLSILGDEFAVIPVECLKNLPQPTRFRKYLTALRKKGLVYCVKRFLSKLKNKLGK
jgi:hypothetical protein